MGLLFEVVPEELVVVGNVVHQFVDVSLQADCDLELLPGEFCGQERDRQWVEQAVVADALWVVGDCNKSLIAQTRCVNRLN